MALWICDSENGGCGHIGQPSDWETIEIKDNSDFVISSVSCCPKCSEDHTTSYKPRKLVDEQYFNEVQQEMKNAGFTFISQVKIDTNDAEYHVPVSYARQTIMFYRLPNKSLIVQMTFYEDDYYRKNDFHSYWCLELHAQYLHYKKLIEMLLSDKDLFEDSETRIPLRDYPLEIDGFRRSHSMSGQEGSFSQYQPTYEQENTHSSILPAQTLVENISKAIDKIKPYLSTFFRKLQITGFWPYYTFPGSASIFWSRFDLEKLKKFVHEPWGGNIPK